MYIYTAGLPVSVTSWDYAGSWNFCCWGPIWNPRPVLDSSAQTTWGMLLDFFVKPQNGLVWLNFSPFFKIFENNKKQYFALNYRWYAWAWYYQAHANQLEFLTYIKNQFPYKPRHLRRVWDLGRQIFDQANPISLWLFWLGPFFTCSKKWEVKHWFYENSPRRSEFSSPRAPMVVSVSSQPLRFFGN